MALEAPRARYQQVADELRRAIVAGEYPSGGALPSQPDLARRYGLNQTTINRAVAVLRHEGLVRVERGRGAYVQELPLVRRLRRVPAGRPGGSTFNREMLRLGLEPKTDLVEVREVEPPADVAEQLGMAEGETALLRTRHMWASGAPVQIASSYIPMSVAGGVGIADPDTNPTGMFERLAARGHRPVRFVEDLEVRLPSAEETAFLRLGDTVPVVEVRRTAYDEQGLPVEGAVNVLAAYRWRLTYEWHADDEEPEETAP